MMRTVFRHTHHGAKLTIGSPKESERVFVSVLAESTPKEEKIGKATVHLNRTKRDHHESVS